MAMERHSILIPRPLWRAAELVAHQDQLQTGALTTVSSLIRLALIRLVEEKGICPRCAEPLGAHDPLGTCPAREED